MRRTLGCLLALVACDGPPTECADRPDESGTWVVHCPNDGCGILGTPLECSEPLSPWQETDRCEYSGVYICDGGLEMTYILRDGRGLVTIDGDGCRTSFVLAEPDAAACR